MTTKTLTATPATFRKIRTLVRHGHPESEISVRMLCAPGHLKAFCATHQISLVPHYPDEPAQPKAGADFDDKPSAPYGISVVIGRGTVDAMIAEAKRRGTTPAKLAAKILLLVSAPHERGENLFAAVLDY